MMTDAEYQAGSPKPAKLSVTSLTSVRAAAGDTVAIAAANIMVRLALGFVVEKYRPTLRPANGRSCACRS